MGGLWLLGVHWGLLPGGSRGSVWAGWELPGQVAKGWCLLLGEGSPWKLWLPLC